MFSLAAEKGFPFNGCSYWAEGWGHWPSHILPYITPPGGQSRTSCSGFMGGQRCPPRRPEQDLALSFVAFVRFPPLRPVQDVLLTPRRPEQDVRLWPSGGATGPCGQSRTSCSGVRGEQLAPLPSLPLSEARAGRPALASWGGNGAPPEGQSKTWP